MVSFGCMFPYINSGGIYILEDMATPSRLAESPVRGNWWGSPDENHQNSRLPGIAATVGAPKQWLPNGKKDLFHCARTTMERFEATGIMTNAFLTDQECQYISDNTDDVKVYEAFVPPIKGSSSIAIVTKKQYKQHKEGIVL